MYIAHGNVKKINDACLYSNFSIFALVVNPLIDHLPVLRSWKGLIVLGLY